MTDERGRDARERRFLLLAPRHLKAGLAGAGVLSLAGAGAAALTADIRPALAGLAAGIVVVVLALVLASLRSLREDGNPPPG
ncbi:MAG: hypothetical protein KatS3mg119_2257 [Rhodothalassiaceae bacterium]|nr:MAG: hypothetical protein KatS3mg119_2257 [Rhodothalassiaceae bacterium]